jgi:hypothetical protein
MVSPQASQSTFVLTRNAASGRRVRATLDLIQLVVHGLYEFDRVPIAHSQYAIELDFIGGALEQSRIFELFDVGRSRRLASPNTSRNLFVVT